MSLLFLTSRSFAAPIQQHSIEVSKQKSVLPVSITIQGVLKSVSIQEGRLTAGEWDLSDNSALHFNRSATLNATGGNTIIYGHNTHLIFGSLTRVRVGDTILITGSDNKTYQFIVDKIKTVHPNQVEILKQTQEKKITLFTCAGLFDSQRLVITGKAK